MPHNNNYNNKDKYYLEIKEDGTISLPDEIRKKMGAESYSALRLVVLKDKIEIYPNIHSLSKLYIEPTTKCNLMCSTCVRNNWEEPMGDMDIEVFNKLIEQLKDFKDISSIMFGGIGEPTCHKDILYMVEKLKQLGLKVEITTNGTTLDDNMIEGFYKNKLDTLWVSFDGVDDSTFEGIRRGATYNNIIESLNKIKNNNKLSEHKIKIGIAFVAMKSNIKSLGNLHKLASKVGASYISVSNLIPYSKEMVEEMLCGLVTSNYDSNNLPELEISLPLIDINDYTKENLFNLLRANYNVSIINNRIGTETSNCKFIKERTSFIRWDGMVCPCMALLHSNSTHSFIRTTFSERKVDSYTLGNIKTQSLYDIWKSDDYIRFRENVDKFDFSPCYSCASCESHQSNKEDCIGSKYPTCGGCLWGQGIIQCP